MSADERLFGEDGVYPHPYRPGGFGCCAVCGLDRDDPDPTVCEHDTAHPCHTCPRAHR